jgi:hypothetical protein
MVKNIGQADGVADAADGLGNLNYETHAGDGGARAAAATAVSSATVLRVVMQWT